MPGAWKRNAGGMTVRISKCIRAGAAALGAAMLANVWHHAQAQAYPSRAVRVVIVSAAGSSGDVGTRVVTSKLSGLWNVAVIVENKPGGNLVPATDTVVKAAPDGYTLLGSQGSMAQNPALHVLPYDTLRDLAPISKFMDTQVYFAVDAKLPVKDLAQFIALAKANPGKYNFASYGTGSTAHLLAAKLNHDAQIDLLHVPYKGVPLAVQAVISGDAAATLADLASLQPHVAAGRIKILAATGTKRSEFSPDIPTFQESGIAGFTIPVWNGFFAPAGTPPAILDKIAADMTNALSMPDVQAAMRQLTFEPSSSTPSEFRALLRQEIEFWSTVVRQSGIKVVD
jgi:tripartite-type tricarboxylate transporter receptor subunit TctC